MTVGDIQFTRDDIRHYVASYLPTSATPSPPRCLISQWHCQWGSGSGSSCWYPSPLAGLTGSCRAPLVTTFGPPEVRRVRSSSPYKERNKCVNAQRWHCRGDYLTFCEGTTVTSVQVFGNCCTEKKENGCCFKQFPWNLFVEFFFLNHSHFFLFDLIRWTFFFTFNSKP